MAESSGTRVVVSGEGLLAEAIADVLDSRGRVERIAVPRLENLDALSAEAEALVVADDRWADPDQPAARRLAAEAGVPWLGVRAELGRLVVGPVERPKVPGCGLCVALRQDRTRSDAPGRRAVLRRHADQLRARPSAWITGPAEDLVGELVAHELSQDAPERVGILVVHLADLSVERHWFLPDPLCASCGDLPDDTAERAALAFVPRPKPDRLTYRVRRVVDELEQLIDCYVDPEVGLVRELKRGTQGGLIVAGAVLPLRFGDVTEPGVGRTRDYRSSETTALLEALERHGGTEPAGTRTVVTGSYAQLADDALDPASLGQHPPESYARADFGFRAYHPDAVCRWVWGYSFARGGPVLVPETCAYYYLRDDSPEGKPFVYEISNGCALGSCLEEAVLHGLLEVLERDAFLLTWYARMAAPRIDLASAEDRAVPLQAAAITLATGYEVLAFDTTPEHGVPCVQVVALAPEARDSERPALVCAAGAHPDPERAVLNAVSEVGPLLEDLVRRWPAEAQRGRRMADDPDLVTTMHDHSTLYGDPRAAARLDFLVQSRELRSVAELGVSGMFGHADLTADLLAAVQRVLAAGMDVVVIDQTGQEQLAGGFRCVKVLVPGALSMTFGHAHRRTDGLTRPLTVPHQLGYRSRPLQAHELNPDPHPFP